MADKSVEVLLEEILGDFVEEEKQTLFDDINKVAKECRKTVQDLSPRGTGEYRKGWAVKVQRDRDSIEATVYNKTRPSLTWLLEKGHVIKNKYGEWGRTAARPHISTAREQAAEQITKLLTKDL